jgi:hypothetical protein
MIKNKRITVALVFCMAMAHFSDGYAEKNFEPYSYEGAKVSLIEPIGNSSRGRVNVRDVDHADCTNCGKNYYFDQNTKVLISETGQYIDIQSLGSQSLDVTSVYVQMPGYVQLFEVHSK